MLLLTLPPFLALVLELLFPEVLLRSSLVQNHPKTEEEFEDILIQLLIEICFAAAGRKYVPDP